MRFCTRVAAEPRRRSGGAASGVPPLAGSGGRPAKRAPPPLACCILPLLGGLCRDVSSGSNGARCSTSALPVTEESAPCCNRQCHDECKAKMILLTIDSGSRPSESPSVPMDPPPLHHIVLLTLPPIENTGPAALPGCTHVCGTHLRSLGLSTGEPRQGLQLCTCFGCCGGAAAVQASVGLG